MVHFDNTIWLSQSNPTNNWLVVNADSTDNEIENRVDKPLHIIKKRENNECIHDEDPEYFTCNNEGGYPNLNDPTCQTYFLCNLLWNGSLVQTLHKCPITSYFDPQAQVCDVEYKCPCSFTSTKNPTTTTTVESTIESEVSSPITTEEVSKESETTSALTTSTSSSTTTSTEVCIYNEDPGYFTCDEKGRYPNLNDLTCQTYFLCNLLRNDSFVRTLYKCPTTSYFNPLTQVCDVDYKCPCSFTSRKNPTTTTTSEPTTERDVSSPVTTEEATTESETTPALTTSTSYSTATSTGVCVYNDDPGYFTCDKKGRYPNLNDFTCQTYFLCNLLRNGSFVQTLYKCPTTSYFNPPTQDKKSNNNDNCGANYRKRSQLSCNTESEMTSALTTSTSSPTATLTELCVHDDDPGLFTCDKKGRYPNLNDLTCQTYFLCNLLRNGSFVQTLYKCPTTSYFNPPTQVCDVDYKCPCSSTSIKSPTKTTTFVPTSERDVSSTVTTGEATTESETTSALTTSTSYSPATSTEVCVYNDDPGYFTCDKKGRYPNLNDPTCQTYFLCNLLRNGSFVQTLYRCPTTSYFNPPTQTLYKCPNTSYFNPPTQVCDVDFKCPCSSTSTKSPTTTTTVEPTTERDVSSPVTTEEAITESETTSALTTSTSYSPATSTGVCVYNDDPGYSTCDKKGRYPNLNDLTCQTYFLCNLLRNGSFVQTLYKCPTTSYFNPPTQVCDVDFKCPCRSTSTKSPTTTTTVEPTTERDVSSPVTTEEATTESESTSTLTISTSSSTATSAEVCVYNNDPGYFTCEKKGRYPNFNDLTCQTYFLCNLLSNGSFVQTLYKCATTSYFIPPTQVCDVDFKCPCSSTSTKSPTTSTTVEPTTERDVSSPVTTEEATTALTTSTSFSPATSTEVCVHNDDPGYFTCDKKGRYPNLNDPTCQTYFLCNLPRNDSFVQTLYKCPTTSYFNPPTQVCDVDYKCPCSSTSTKSPTISTTVEPTTAREVSSPVTTEEATTESGMSSALTTSTSSSTATSTEVCVHDEDPGYFSCDKKGRYPNLNDFTCQTYFLCNLLRNGSFVQTLYKCPTTSYFNPPTQVCDVDFKCPCSSTSTKSPTTTTTVEPTTRDVSSPVTTEEATTESETSSALTISTTSSTATSTDVCVHNEDPEYFSCVKKGRYPNLNDLTCQTYFLCNLLRNGSFVQTLFKCPTTSYFSPPTQTLYKCRPPHISFHQHRYVTLTSNVHVAPQVQKSTTSTTVEPTTERDVSSPVTTEEATTALTTSTSFPGHFNRRRYPNLNDLTCQTYFLCNLLRNDSFVQTLYKCPTTSYFNPPTQVCDVDYKCPCSSTSTKSPTISTTVEPTTKRISSPVLLRGYSESGMVQSDYLHIISTATSTEGYPNLNDFTCQLTSATPENGSSFNIYKLPLIFNPPTRSPVTTEEASTESETSSARTTSTSSSTATSTEVCVYHEDPGYLTCDKQGRYPNLNDLTCQSYFLCNLLRNGSFVQTLYKCPTTSYFNPPTQVCDVYFKCPCSSTSTKSPTTTTTVEPTTERDVSFPVTTEEATTESETSSALTTPTSSSTATSTEVCVYNEDPGYFTCDKKGRYPNLNDLTCQTYFLCNLLRNDSFVQTLYECPTTSYFNPPTQVCDVDYKCPCSSTSTKSPTTTTTVEPTTEREVSSPVTTEEATTKSEMSSALTTPTSSSTATSTEVCVHNEDPGYFTCDKKGRYPNLNDLTCQTYFLCNLLRNGSFVQTLYKCPTTSYFNPPTQVCDVDYKCPCSSTTTKSPTTLTTVEPTTEREVSSPVTTEEATTESEMSSGLTTSTSSSTATSTEVCVYNEDPGYFTCDKKGRYPNLNDPTCQTYFLCNLLRNGSYVQTLYKCPTTSYFNPPTQVCDVDFKCLCSSTSTKSPTTTTTVETTTERDVSSPVTTEEATTESETSSALTTTTSSSTATSTEVCVYNEDPGYFTCDRKGRYLNLNDLTCQTYFLCNLLRNGSFVRHYTNVQPPHISIHQHSSPVTTEEATTDSETSLAPTTSTSYSTATSTEVCVYNEDPGYFTCDQKGRYPNLNDLTCQTYFLCNLLRNDSFVQTLYKCPTTSYFNPPTQVCDVDYKCPCSSTSTKSPTTSTTVEPTTEREDNSSVITEEATTESEMKVCVHNEDPGYSTCDKKGRYPNLNDLTCQTYFLCNLLRNGSFVQTLYKCPTTSYFNPPTQVCDVDFKCPCSSTSTKSPTTTTTVEPTTERDFSSPVTTEEATTESETSSAPTISTSSSTATSSDVCVHNEDPVYFTCDKKGRYPNLNDLTCQTYFLCNLLRNDSFVQTLYKCPTTSYFNPTTQVCDVDYKCPCSSTSTKSPTTSTTVEPTTERVVTSSVTTEEATTESGMSSALTTSTSSPTATSTEVCVYNEDPGYFTCDKKGRYPNLNDLTCQTYFLCNLLRNGSYVQTVYKCPTTSYFNPPTQVCDVDFQCPCSSTSTKCPTTTTTVEPTTERDVSSPVTTESETSSALTTTTSYFTATSTEVCVYDEDPGYFTCDKKGRYPNLNDLTCQSYFLCNLLRNGSFVQTLYKCPTTSYFNPPTQVCDVDFKCPCNSSSTKSPTTTTTVEPTTERDVSSPVTTEEATTESETSSALTISTSSSTATSTDVCVHNEDPGYFTCDKKGRYPNLNDFTCQTYFLCNLLRNGSFVQTLYKCPTTSYFNPPTQVCDVDYKCPCSSTSTKSSTTTTLEQTTEREVSSPVTTT
ncbi:hypothetical protein JTB14_012270 [Gonioctena quinquepunctata]|nr:hypothetical protein JTB14_012270 [Gonioctena quinquepunctata]